MIFRRITDRRPDGNASAERMFSVQPCLAARAEPFLRRLVGKGRGATGCTRRAKNAAGSRYNRSGSRSFAVTLIAVRPRSHVGKPGGTYFLPFARCCGKKRAVARLGSVPLRAMSCRCRRRCRAIRNRRMVSYM